MIVIITMVKILELFIMLQRLIVISAIIDVYISFLDDLFIFLKDLWF